MLQRVFQPLVVQFVLRLVSVCFVPELGHQWGTNMQKTDHLEDIQYQLSLLVLQLYWMIL